MPRKLSIKGIPDSLVVEKARSLNTKREILDSLYLKDNSGNRGSISRIIKFYCDDADSILKKLENNGRRAPRQRKVGKSRIHTTYNDIEFTNLVMNSDSISTVMRGFDTKCHGNMYRLVVKKINDLNISTSHFVGNGVNKFGTTPLHEIIIEGKHPHYNRGALKARLYREGLKTEKCEECGIKDWNGKKISFHLDHINGHGKDHRFENLKILCPNCHSQTPTFAGRNIRLKRLRKTD